MLYGLKHSPDVAPDVMAPLPGKIIILRYVLSVKPEMGQKCLASLLVSQKVAGRPLPSKYVDLATLSEKD